MLRGLRGFNQLASEYELGYTGRVPLTTSKKDDFTIEVLNIIIHMLQGSYRRVGNLDPKLKFLSRPGPPKSPVTTASRTLKVGP
ncbi:hypothetical protein BY996DRAFT_8399162 [Phakopsora pachyrhizi]|nr:hypothetical protein BY996DRAFT_8399162 [Phakopsora pachyrhizi]